MRLLESTCPVVITPFTAEAVLLFHICRNKGIPVLCFADNKEALWNKEYEETPIQSPAAAWKENPSAQVVLCAYRSYDILTQQLSEVGFSPVRRMEEVLESADLPAGLAAIDSKQLKELAPRQTPRLERLEIEMQSYLFPKRALEEDAIVLTGLTVTVTERCTLKCEACCDLMQYYHSPKPTKMEKVCQDFDSLMETVDFIRFVYVTGGEPLLCQEELPQLLRHLYTYRERYGVCELITNGTLLPTNALLEAVKETGTFFRVSNYGEHSSKKEEILKHLEKWKIPHQMKPMEWHLQAQIIPGEGRNAMDAFSVCDKANACNLLKGGRLYLCPFLGHGEALGAFPADPANHLSLEGVQRRQAAKRYLSGQTPPPGCAFCSGYRKKDAATIPPAVQTKEPIPYRRYD